MRTKHGITWYSENGTVAQTGYVFSRRRANRIGRAGAEAPDFWTWADGQHFQVDGMSDPVGEIVRADNETEDHATTAWLAPGWLEVSG